MKCSQSQARILETTSCLAVEGGNFLSKVSKLCDDKGLNSFQNGLYLGVQEMNSLAQKSMSLIINFVYSLFLYIICTVV
jgi:hypothetical protein